MDKIIEMSGDFVATFLRVMPHAAEPERLKKNLATMHEVKVRPCPSIWVSRPKPWIKLIFRLTAAMKASLKTTFWK